MLPIEFSIRGPHGTYPWVAIVDNEPMLLWATSHEEAEGIVSGWHRNTNSLRLFGVTNRNHHLGSARNVPLTEVGG